MQAVYLRGLALIVAFGLVAEATAAQTLRNADEPAEFPPSSYTGQQYVDSRGCVYVRAGFDDAVTWVPRVRRDRTVVCGARPTFAAQPQPDVPVIPDPPATVAEASSSGTPASGASTSGAPTRAVGSAPSARTAAAPTQPTQSTRTAPAQSAQSQTAPTPKAATRRVAAPAPKAAAQPTQTRRAAPAIEPPKGYRAAWTDGRLNPNRARGTAEGRAQMARVWSNQVPQRLLPGGANVRVSTKTSPLKPAAGGRYVQVGSFTVPSNAESAAAKLRAAGLPVRFGRFAKGDQSYRVVLAGPFNAADLQTGLRAARQLGFSGAFARR